MDVNEVTNTANYPIQFNANFLKQQDQETTFAVSPIAGGTTLTLPKIQNTFASRLKIKIQDASGGANADHITVLPAAGDKVVINDETEAWPATISTSYGLLEVTLFPFTNTWIVTKYIEILPG